MTRALLLLLAALHVAAASLPCPPRPGGRELGRAAAAGHAHRAVHATHHAPLDAGAGREAAAGVQDLRAPCPCGCDDGPAGGLAGARLGPLGLPSGSSPVRPTGASLVPAPSDALASAQLPLPDPVPRAA